MLQETLSLIAKRKEAVQKRLLPPADAAALASLRDSAREQFGVELPSDYLRFLSLTNGLSHNGLHIYGATANTDNTVFAFVVTNLTNREPDMTDYLFFGSNPPDVLVWNLNEGTFEVAARFAHYAFESFESCGELLIAVESCGNLWKADKSCQELW